MEEVLTTNNNNLNDLNNNDEKNNEEIDEIIITKLIKISTLICVILCSLPSFPLLFPIYIIFFVTPYKSILVFDGAKKRLIKGNRGLWGCCPYKYSCFRNIERIYNLSQIQKVKMYRTSSPDPQVAFNKLYFINCDIYSLDNEKEPLFTQVPFSQEKYDEFITFFKKHFNTEIIPLEVDINNYDVNNQDIDLYPQSNEFNQTSNKPVEDESTPFPISP